MVCYKFILTTLGSILAAIVPSLLCRQVRNDIVCLQPADILIFCNAMIMQETAVGKDERSVRLGGEDALVCIYGA